MAELADARDLKSRGTKVPYRFDPGFRHQLPVKFGKTTERCIDPFSDAYTINANLISISRGGADGSSSGS